MEGDLFKWLEQWKERKKNRFKAVWLYFNHPHRLSEVAMSGALTYVIDERLFVPEPATSAKVYEFDLGFAVVPAWSRLFYPKFPFDIEAPQNALAAGQFVLAHLPWRMWNFATVRGPGHLAVKVGTSTVSEYSRPSENDPWTLDTTATYDIEFFFDPTFSFGGDPDSDGRGDDSADEKAEIRIENSGFGGPTSSRLPSFSELDTPYEIRRFPWMDAWASETDYFAWTFNDFLADRNAQDGGGHSGSCTMSLDFT